MNIEYEMSPEDFFDACALAVGEKPVLRFLMVLFVLLSLASIGSPIAMWSVHAAIYWWAIVGGISLRALFRRRSWAAQGYARWLLRECRARPQLRQLVYATQEIITDDRQLLLNSPTRRCRFDWKCVNRLVADKKGVVLSMIEPIGLEIVFVPSRVFASSNAFEDFVHFCRSSIAESKLMVESHDE
jgi:hypothetical protein